jgi:hypothetical protein
LLGYQTSRIPIRDHRTRRARTTLFLTAHSEQPLTSNASAGPQSRSESVDAVVASRASRRGVAAAATGAVSGRFR